MIRISTIFVAICMVLIAASLAMVVYSLVGFTAGQAFVVSLAALTLLILYSAISMRLQTRTDASQQIADLSHGTTELARQIAEFGRRLAAVEGKIVSANSANQDRVQAVSAEIGELGQLVKQLATSVATHEELLIAGTPRPQPVAAQPAAKPAPQPPVSLDPAARPVPPLPIAKPEPIAAPTSRDAGQLLTAIRNAVEAGRIDIYLQPMVTLPQRKVRFYEVVSRLRDEQDRMITADEFLATAESEGLIGQIDQSVMLRAMQVLRRLQVRNKDVGVFVNVSAATLGQIDVFTQCLDFLEANRALAPSFVLEFKQTTFRALGALETEHLAALAQRGYRFSIDHVTDLRFEPRDLADRGVRFIKVPASLLLDPREHPASDIHPADLSDLLGRFGIDLVAERIEGERAVVDLLDYDVRFGQGFLFATPRPLRPEGAAAPAAAEPATPVPAAAAPAQQDPILEHDSAKPRQGVPPIRIDPPRASGNAALARRAAGPV